MSVAQDNTAQIVRDLIASIATKPGRRCLLVIDPVLRPIEAEEEKEEGPWQHYARLDCQVRG